MANWDVFVCRFWCGNLWLDTFKRIGRTFFYSSSCGIDIHASPFQGNFDRVTIDQLILLCTSLLLSFRQIRKWIRSEFRWNNRFLYLGSFRQLSRIEFGGLRCACLQILVWNLLDWQIRKNWRTCKDSFRFLRDIFPFASMLLFNNNNFNCWNRTFST